MRFLTRKRKQTPTIIIVALIDVLIVLLIFLMVTTTFKQQPALRLALPESTTAQKAGATNNAPLLISIDAKGVMRLGADALPVTIERLREELSKRVKANPDLKVALNADKDAPFGQIIKVVDATKESGIKSIPAFMKEAARQ